jgi:hypothetical protein
MLSWKRLIAPVAGLALLVGLQQAQLRADDTTATPAAKATVTVTVVDASGNKVSGATVGIYPKPAKKHKADAGATTQPTDDTKKAKPEAIVSGETGADGTVALANVPNGDFVAMAKLKGTGNGRAPVTVSGGADTTVTVTLKAKKAAN